MEVDVVPMRVKGVKLEREELKRAHPVRGTLSVRSRLGRGKDLVIVAMLLKTGTTTFALPVLDHMRMTRLQGNSFVLFGFEELATGGRAYRDYPQSWWVRPAQAPVALDDDDGASDPSVMADLYAVQS
jgi:hypothetical protein